MKKKLFIGGAALLFAAVTALNMDLLQSNKTGDVSLDAIAVMAQAQEEASAVTGWLYDTFGGNWASKDEICHKVETRDTSNANVCVRVMKNGIWVCAEVSNGRGTYTTSYPYTVCVNGRGNCWSSGSC